MLVLPAHRVVAVARAAIVALVKPVLVGANRMRSKRVLRSIQAPAKLVIGAGPTRYAGWVVTDIGWRTVYLDATKPWGVDGKVSHVYCDNMIEHVPFEDGRAMLRHAHDALMPGGRLRIVTPDAETSARIYLERSEATDRLLAYFREEELAPARHPVDLLNAAAHWYSHHEGYMWDFDALAAEMKAVGFSDVRRYPPNVSDDPHFAAIPARANITQLAVEAVA
jgi:predicted SAM-dependent methyltransferase